MSYNYLMSVWKSDEEQNSIWHRALIIYGSHMLASRLRQEWPLLPMTSCSAYEIQT